MDILIIAFIFYIMYYGYLTRFRIPKAEKFMYRNIELCSEWDERHIKELVNKKEISSFDWFYKKHPSFVRLIFSFRPLSLDQWFNKKDLQKLFN